MRGCILVVEDDVTLSDLLRNGLSRRGYEARTCGSAQEALARIADEPVDVVLTDLKMPDKDGLQLCEEIAKTRPDIPVVVMTAFGSLDTAVAAIRVGAYDFVTKPFDLNALVLTLERAIAHRRMRDELRRLRQEVARAYGPADFLGQSDAARKVLSFIDRVGDTEATVLITGESGTGKELAARALHQRSRRREGSFVAINCAAMPEALLESELFGHARGAFTDARGARTGLFVQADGGTLFLDEIGELPLGLQPKLLRALQERKVRPVGADAEVTFDVRIIAATNKDLEQEVEERRFREDLFYRLNVIQLVLPPLRTRAGDVLLLAQAFLQGFAQRMNKNVTGITPPAAERLVAYPWPGNVRELQNSMERAVALAQFERITVQDLPERVQNPRPPQASSPEAPEPLLSLEEVERRHILKVLAAVNNSKTSAARILGLDRKTLYRKLERYGVERGQEPEGR